MNKWEYTRRSVDVSTKLFKGTKVEDDYLSDLNDLGQDGWELVAAVPLTGVAERTIGIELILKRSCS